MKGLTERGDEEKESEKAKRGGREEVNGIWEEEERQRERESVSD